MVLLVVPVRVLSLDTSDTRPLLGTSIFSLVTHVLWCVTSFPMERKVSVGKQGAGETSLASPLAWQEYLSPVRAVTHASGNSS